MLLQFPTYQRTKDEILGEKRKDHRFKGYYKMPEYISRYMGEFGLVRDDAKCRETTELFYILIKLVDDQFDLREVKRPDLAHMLEGEMSPTSDDCSILMDSLRKNVPANQRTVASHWKTLLDAMYRERDANTIREYLENRKNSGKATARITCELLAPYTKNLSIEFREFFSQAGEAGIVIDTLIDLPRDQASGELPFTPSLRDKIFLYEEALKEGASLMANYPFIVSDVMRVLSRWAKRAIT